MYLSQRKCVFFFLSCVPLSFLIQSKTFSSQQPLFTPERAGRLIFALAIKMEEEARVVSSLCSRGVCRPRPGSSGPAPYPQALLPQVLETLKVPAFPLQSWDVGQPASLPQSRSLS